LSARVFKVSASGASRKWKNSIVRFPKIRVRDRALTINRGQGIPETLCSFFIPAADINTGNFTCVPVFCEPDPNLIALVIHKRPQLITFKGKPTFGLFFTFTFLGISSYLSLT